MSNVQINSSEIDNILNQLSDDEIKNKILFDAVKEGARVLQQSAQDSFKRTMGEAAMHHSRFINKPFYEGVKMITEKQYTEAVVSIMSDYRMRFYENQIKERKTKKGYNRGIVTAKHFFRDARNQSQQAVNEAMMDSIKKSLDKIK